MRAFASCAAAIALIGAPGSAQAASDTEAWYRSQCTVDGFVVPECIVLLAAAINTEDRVERGALEQRAEQAVRARRDLVEHQRCERAGHPPGRVRLGMTQLEVRHCGWGAPTRLLGRTTSSSGFVDRWLYEHRDGAILHFRNHVLFRIEEH